MDSELKAVLDSLVSDWTQASSLQDLAGKDTYETPYEEGDEQKDAAEVQEHILMNMDFALLDPNEAKFYVEWADLTIPMYVTSFDEHETYEKIVILHVVLGEKNYMIMVREDGDMQNGADNSDFMFKESTLEQTKAYAKEKRDLIKLSSEIEQKVFSAEGFEEYAV